jgi:hypothetical protein
VPDSFKERELTGGVGLPKAKVRLADGSVLKRKAACEALEIDPGPLDITTLPEPLYRSLRNPGGEAPTFPSFNPPTWRAFYNIQFSLGCACSGECGGNPERTGGQYSNIDNNYVSAYGSRAFAQGPVMVLEGRLPKFQRTGKKVKRMPDGQLRYWSLCQNESLFTTIGKGCLYDSQVPVDRKGRYTIVTSLASDRPSNARRMCGVGFLAWPERGDGAGNVNHSLLLLRNMLPAEDFDRAVQDTETPGDEREVMGSFLPRGSYTTKEAFERSGC